MRLRPIAHRITDALEAHRLARALRNGLLQRGAGALWATRAGRLARGKRVPSASLCAGCQRAVAVDPRPGDLVGFRCFYCWGVYCSRCGVKHFGPGGHE